MKRTGRAVAALALAAVLSGLLSGCTGLRFGSVEELYALPSLPAEYQALEESINALIDEGAEYAAPSSGSNIQPVQLVDLDGDGQEEALAFMRKPAEERPLKIYIFSPEEGGYRRSAVLEGSGSAIFSIVYSDLDGDGRTELVVGWKTASEVQALTVYTLRSGQPEELLRTPYVKYALVDLNGSGRSELVVFRADTDGHGLAEMYGWQDGTLALQSSSRISVSMAELSNLGRVTSGALRDGTPALFVVGVVDSSVEITDILTAQDGELRNIVLSGITGTSTEVARFLSLYPTDINGDRITEVPVPVLLTGSSEEQSYYRVEWRSYDASGAFERAMSAYHSTEDGWYLVLPESWRDRVLVRRELGAEESTTVFSYRSGLDQVDFMKISAVTGNSREIKAVRGGRFILSRRAETIYCAELLAGNADWPSGMTEDELRTAFNLVTEEWQAGDN